jgi:hypothetical protein
VLLSGTGRRLGAVSDGGRLPDGTVAHTIKRARLYRILLQQAVDRGVAAQFGKRLVDATATADGIHSATRRLIDPAAPAGPYVGLVNFGGYTDHAAPTHKGCSHQTLLSLLCGWSRGWTSVCGFGLDLLDRGVEPVGRTAGTGHLGQVHLVDIPANDQCRDRSGEAGLIVKRGGVRRMGRNRDGGDHTLDEGDGHPDA